MNNSIFSAACILRQEEKPDQTRKPNFEQSSIKLCVSCFFPIQKAAPPPLLPFDRLSDGRCCGDDEDAAVGDKKKRVIAQRAAVLVPSHLTLLWQVGWSGELRLNIECNMLCVLCFVHTEP